MSRWNTAGGQYAIYNAPGTAEGECSNGALSGSCANRFDKGLLCVPAVDEFREQGRVDGGPSFWPVAQDRHVGDFEKISLEISREGRSPGRERPPRALRRQEAIAAESRIAHRAGSLASLRVFCARLWARRIVSA